MHATKVYFSFIVFVPNYIIIKNSKITCYTISISKFVLTQHRIKILKTNVIRTEFNDRLLLYTIVSDFKDMFHLCEFFLQFFLQLDKFNSKTNFYTQNLHSVIEPWRS